VYITTVLSVNTALFGARGSVVDCGTMLQAGSLVTDPNNVLGTDRTDNTVPLLLYPLLRSRLLGCPRDRYSTIA
jgi:hypothetical protein